MYDAQARKDELTKQRDAITATLNLQKASLDQQAAVQFATIDGALAEIEARLNDPDTQVQTPAPAQPEAQPEQGIDPATGQPYESSTPTVDANGQPQDQQPQ